MNLEIRRLDPTTDDKEKVLRLARDVFGNSWKIMEKKWEWQYMPNPYFSVPPLYLATKGDRVVSVLGYIPVTLIKDGKEIDSAWLIDAMTDPAFRRSGISAQVHERVENEVTVVLAKSISGVIMKMAERRNYQFLNSGLYVARILSWKALLAGKLRKAVYHAPDIGGTWDDGIQLPGGVSRVNDFDSMFNKLGERAKFWFPCSIKRSSTYLRWRYLQCPIGIHRAFQIAEGGHLQGMIVVSRTYEKRLNVGWILDLVCDPLRPDIFDRLMEGAIYFFRRKKVAIVKALVTDGVLGKRFSKHLFRSTGIHPKIAFGSSVISSQFPSDTRRWQFVEGDSDSFLYRFASNG